MAGTANKTVQTDSDVEAFIERVADERQREDARTLVATMARLWWWGEGMPAGQQK